MAEEEAKSQAMGSNPPLHTQQPGVCVSMSVCMCMHIVYACEYVSFFILGSDARNKT